MEKVNVMFKNGKTLNVEVDKVTVRLLDNSLVGITWEGLKNIKPMYMDLDEVLCVYQVLEWRNK